MTEASKSAVTEAPQATGSEETQEQYVTFALMGQRYAIDIMAVREIRISNAIASLPGAPDYIRGVTNLRGTIIPVMDLRLRFGLPPHPQPAAGVVIVASLAGKLTGLLVDEVCDILSPASGAAGSLPIAGPAHDSPFFAGLVMEGEEMLIVLKPERLMPHAAMGERPSLTLA